MSQSYADTNQVNFSYANVPTAGPRGTGVYRYGVGYGDLTGVLFGVGGGAVEITLAAAAGYELSLLDFDFASFAGRSSTTPIRITDLAGNVISEGRNPQDWSTAMPITQ